VLPLDLDEAQMPGAGIAAFDVIALLLGRHIARLVAEHALRRHQRLHGDLLDHRSGRSAVVGTALVNSAFRLISNTPTAPGRPPHPECVAPLTATSS
jgi:hypothetical protein